MRKNICILLCVLAASFTFAQIRTNGVPASTISNQSAFIDASSSLFTGSTNSGKGIAFPRTDLTIFTFNPSAGNAFGFPTGFDGFLVHNSATGTTPATGSGVGNQSVVPGIYYFSNPGSTGDTTTGSWVMIMLATTNLAPEANSVSFSGTLELGELLTGSYSYSDADSDPEGTSTFQWYRADDASGTNQTAISGATSSTYTLQAADENKYVAFEVTPVASSGTSPGASVLSSYQGAVIDGNVAPVASSVNFSGDLVIGELLTGSYSYSDADSDPEGTSTFQWYRADDASGTNQTAISGATTSTYTLQAADENKYIAFEVTPVASSGVSPGASVLSSYQGAVTNTPTVTGPGGLVWMDRNLGATQVATSKTDTQAYGDLYQWGRLTDGHEDRNSSITNTLSAGDVPGHGDFIANGDPDADWRSTQNDNLWQGLNGINNPCPTGFRLPTQAEWQTEVTIYDAANDPDDSAFSNALKLTICGRRKKDGSLEKVGDTGYYWTSTVNGQRSEQVKIDDRDAKFEDKERVRGVAVRCIED